MKDHVTAEALRGVLNYEAETGRFTWKVQSNGRSLIGSAAGHARRGYVFICISQRRYLAHRLAWLYVHGELPHGVIDHINGDGTDNRLCNLRDVPQSMNAQNQRRAHSRNKSSGLLGVTFDPKAGKYRSQISSQGKTRYLGWYESPEEAHAVYMTAKRELHPGCTV